MILTSGETAETNPVTECSAPCGSANDSEMTWHGCQTMLTAYPTASGRSSCLQTSTEGFSLTTFSSNSRTLRPTCYLRARHPGSRGHGSCPTRPDRAQFGITPTRGILVFDCCSELKFNLQNSPLYSNNSACPRFLRQTRPVEIFL